MGTEVEDLKIIVIAFSNLQPSCELDLLSNIKRSETQHNEEFLLIVSKATP